MSTPKLNYSGSFTLHLEKIKSLIISPPISDASNAEPHPSVGFEVAYRQSHADVTYRAVEYLGNLNTTGNLQLVVNFFVNAVQLTTKLH